MSQFDATLYDHNVDEGGRTALECELGNLMIEALNLECDLADIDPTAPLFGSGLGLDSIDALELSLVLSKVYGYELRSDDPDNSKTLSSLRALAAQVERRRRF